MRRMSLSALHPDRPGFRPLYQQVRDLLLARIADGVWRPAEALPSEQTLAVELGVSQGTVRKALDSLAADNLVARRQGKGTYVVEHTQESANFRFFKVTRPDGTHTVPSCGRTAILSRAARPAERERLSLSPRADVFQIKRDRTIDGVAAIRELIIVPQESFPDLDARMPLPNTLYTLYQSVYGVSIVSASEQIRAVSATRDDASALDVAVGAPLLQVDRVATDLTGRQVEWRQSRLSTEHYVYGVELR